MWVHLFLFELSSSFWSKPEGQAVVSRRSTPPRPTRMNASETLVKGLDMKRMPGMLWGLSLHGVVWVSLTSSKKRLHLSSATTRLIGVSYALTMEWCNPEGQGHSISILSHPVRNSYVWECLISIKSSCWSRLRLFTARAVNAPPTKSTSGVLYLGIDGKLCNVTAWKHRESFPTISSTLSLWEWKTQERSCLGKTHDSCSNPLRIVVAREKCHTQATDPGTSRLRSERIMLSCCVSTTWYCCLENRNCSTLAWLKQPGCIFTP